MAQAKHMKRIQYDTPKEIERFRCCLFSLFPMSRKKKRREKSDIESDGTANAESI